MWNMEKGPSEIIRVRRERKTLLIRVPPFWGRQRGIGPGDYLLGEPDGSGGLVLRLLKDVIRNGERIGDSQDG